MTMREEIDRILQDAVDRGDVPGVIAVAVNDRETLYSGAFGVRSLETRVPMEVDTVLWYASMTKALVSTGAVQLVEQGKVGLDEPLGDLLPGLKSPQVLEGFGEDGAPIVRPAKRPVTLRHLLTHTSGYGYDIWNADVERYMRENDVPLLVDCKLKSLEQPLAADPGEKWEYGISIDWVGQVVEAVSGQSLEDYLIEHLLRPLGMNDTNFLIGDRRPRLAHVHQRQADGSLLKIENEINQEPEFFMGGGGIYGTAPDYAKFVQMMLNDGMGANGTRVLKPETVELMAANHIGDIQAGVLNSVLHDLSYPLVDFFPGTKQGWGLSFLINMEDSPHGRSAGSLCWAGLANTYFWIDRKKKLGGVIMTQILPFGDPKVIDLYNAFERQVYGVAAEPVG